MYAIVYNHVVVAIADKHVDSLGVRISSSRPY